MKGIRSRLAERRSIRCPGEHEALLKVDCAVIHRPDQHSVEIEIDPNFAEGDSDFEFDLQYPCARELT